MADGGDAGEVPDCILEPVVCELLGVTPLELRQLDLDTIYTHLGHAQGKAVGRWAHEHKPPGQDNDNG